MPPIPPDARLELRAFADTVPDRPVENPLLDLGARLARHFRIAATEDPSSRARAGLDALARRLETSRLHLFAVFEDAGLKTYPTDRFWPVTARRALDHLAAQDTMPDLAARVFRHLPLQGAGLDGLHAPGTVFMGCFLQHARLPGARLADCRVSICDLSHADLAAADLAGSELRDCDAAYASFAGAALTKAHLVRLDLTGADLRRTDLRGTRLAACNLPLARLKDAGPLTPDTFRSSSLAGAYNAPTA